MVSLRLSVGSLSLYKSQEVEQFGVSWKDHKCLLNVMKEHLKNYPCLILKKLNKYLGIVDFKLISDFLHTFLI